MRKKYLWARENYWLNIITIIMTAISISQISMFADDIQSSREELYQFLKGSYPGAEYYGTSVSSVYSNFMGRTQAWYLLMIAGIIVISILLFRDMKAKETKEWICSLPLSRKEIFWHQWFRGMIAYTIPHAVFACGAMALYYQNRNWIYARYLTDVSWKVLLSAEAPVQYVKLFFMIWLWATACYSLFFLMQIICRNNLIAAMSGMGILYSPLYISQVVYRILRYGSDETWISKIFESLERYFLMVVHNGTEDAEYLYGNGYMDGSCFFIQSYCVRIDQVILILIVILGCTALAYRYFHGMSDQKSEGIFSALWIRYVILTGLGCCIGMGIFMNLIYYRGIGGKGMFLAGTVFFTAIFAVTVNRLMRRRGY